MALIELHELSLVGVYKGSVDNATKYPIKDNSICPSCSLKSYVYSCVFHRCVCVFVCHRALCGVCVQDLYAICVSMSYVVCMHVPMPYVVSVCMCVSMPYVVCMCVSPCPLCDVCIPHALYGVCVSSSPKWYVSVSVCPCPMYCVCPCVRALYSMYVYSPMPYMLYVCVYVCVHTLCAVYVCVHAPCSVCVPP